MNYELKSIRAGSVFFNALRIFLVVGFLVAVLSIYVLRTDPRLDALAWWQRFLLMIVYTVVYDFVISVMLAIIAGLYNFWAGSAKGISIHLEQE
jgi:hypothetical protein